MNLLMFEITSILEPPDFMRLILAIVIVYVTLLFDSRRSKIEREKLLAHQRQAYYKQLTAESLRMECEKLKGQIELVKSIEKIKNDGNRILEKLKAEGMDDSQFILNGSNSMDYESSDSDCDTNNRDPENVTNREVIRLGRQLKEELGQLQSKAQELKHVSDEISKIQQSSPGDSNNIISETSSTNETEKTLKDLGQKIAQLESENDELRKQISNHKNMLGLNSYGLKKDSKLDDNLLRYLEAHDSELTLSFLEKAYDTLIELKASNPGKDLSEYIDELKSKQKNYVTELAEFMVAKKEVEIRLQTVRKRYEEELADFNECRIEHLFKNSGAKEFLDSIKEKNQLNDEIISNLRSELEYKRNEAEILKSKFQEAEKQCNVYFEAWKETQLKKDQIEAERRYQLDY